MERFVKAVELARKDLEPVPVEQPTLHEIESATVESLRPREPVRQPPTSRVQYGQTRRVSVSPDALRTHHITGGQERTPVAESFKRIRTQVIQRLRDTGCNTLGIASPRSGEGKTTVALNLAVHTAVEPDWTVLVVETDIHHAGMTEALGLPALPGLTDYLLRDEPLEELLIDPGIGRCVLLPAGPPIPGSSEALGSARMRDLVMELKRRYPDRLVIFDLPPLLDAADGIAVLPWVEALVLVAEEGRTLADDVVRSAQLVGNDRMLGTILNKSQIAVPVPGERPGFLRRFFTGSQ